MRFFPWGPCSKFPAPVGPRLPVILSWFLDPSGLSGSRIFPALLVEADEVAVSPFLLLGRPFIVPFFYLRLLRRRFISQPRPVVAVQYQVCRLTRCLSLLKTNVFQFVAGCLSLLGFFLRHSRLSRA